MKKITLVLAFSSLISSMIFGQYEDKKWSLGVDIGLLDYNGEMSNNIVDIKGGIDYGLSLQKYLNRSFDLMVIGNYGRVSDSYYNANEQVNHMFSAKVAQLDLALKYKLLKGKIFTPSIFAGIGFFGSNSWTTWHQKTIVKTLPAVNAGLDLDLRLAPAWSVNARFKFNRLFTDRLDGLDKQGTSKHNDDLGFTSIGINYMWGKKKDKDKDGIADRKDECPEVFGLAEFKGCPDTDADGIKDSEDACPTVAGLAEFGGCPDTDKDGVKDSEDACPEVAGSKEMGGCPDTDGDGIKDSEDACPEIAGTLNGCPDGDNDGVADKDDACPTVAGTINGCPDSDNDGVIDSKDKCPNVAGVASNNGCPEVKKPTIVIPTFNPVYFNFGNATFVPGATTKLNKIVESMKANPTFKVTVSGHTDNVGEKGVNQSLSVQRANAVKNYLVRLGVDASRISTQGFGQNKPAATNSTAVGRQKNRRAEPVISN